MRASTRLAAVATIAVAALTAGGCSAGGSGDQPVELTYWAWAPELEKVVEIWNDQNPDIQVTVNKQDGGDPAITKLLTAIKAGNGAPDLIQAEYQKIPTLVSSDALADISGELDDSVAGEFSDGTWDSVTLGGDAVYAVPQDSGPMMFYYRADIFAELGLAVPTTWDEYAEAARVISTSRPGSFLGTFSANDAGWFSGLAQQAGASWWGIDGDAWSVDIDAEATQKVAQYWGGLVEEGVIDNRPMYTPEWNAGLNDGTQVGWISSVWGPGVLAGNAGDTEGLWEAALLPQWNAGDETNGNWGGSSTAVTTQSDHTAEAVEFATWLNTDPEAVAALADISGVYPAAVDAAADALSDPPPFIANQADFYEVAAQASEQVQPFTYGPNVNVAFSAYNDEFAEAAEARTAAAFTEAVGRMQQITVDDLESAGFTVE